MKRKSRLTVAAVTLVLLLTFLLTAFLPSDPNQYLYFSLLPAVSLIVYIFITKEIIVGLIVASLMGLIMISRPETMGGGNWLSNIFSNFSNDLLEVMMDENTQWLIIVCGGMGSIIALIEKTGGALGFGEWAARRVKSQKSALLWAWVLGIIIFIDDYLNSLIIGSCMTTLTDKHKTPRECLAYVVDSTAAPTCTLIPISTWAVYVARVLEMNHWAPEGEGMAYFIRTIPYNFYAWAALLTVPFVILGIIPKIGAMKKAFDRVENGGTLAPKGSEKIAIHLENGASAGIEHKIMNFAFPIAILVITTVLMDSDMQKGVLVTLAFCFIFYLAQGILSAEAFIECSISGFKNMILPLLITVLSFLFAKVNGEIHFTEYVIQSVAFNISPNLLPFVLFLVLSLTEFITANNWGMYVIALPIVIPLAQSLHVNVPLAVAAVLSAGVFGSHISFYSDATVLTSAATGCDNMQHALTQLPYGLISAGVAAILFLIAGFLTV